MRTVRMVTAIPKALAMELREKKRIINFNTLPQLHPKLIDSIKKYFEEVVGYHDSPIACLSRVGHKDSTIKSIGASVCDFIPVKANDSVVLELNMPEDCIVSIGYEDLLNFSRDLTDCNGDRVAENDTLAYFLNFLSVGLGDGCSDTISFVPFIEMEKCQFFAILDKSFGLADFSLRGVEKVSLHELNTFI